MSEERPEDMKLAGTGHAGTDCDLQKTAVATMKIVDNAIQICRHIATYGHKVEEALHRRQHNG